MVGDIVALRDRQSHLNTALPYPILLVPSEVCEPAIDHVVLGAFPLLLAEVLKDVPHCRVHPGPIFYPYCSINKARRHTRVPRRHRATGTHQPAIGAGGCE